MADAVREPAGEEARDEHRQGKRREEEATGRDAVPVAEERHEARDAAVAERAEEEGERDAYDAPLDQVAAEEAIPAEARGDGAVGGQAPGDRRHHEVQEGGAGAQPGPPPPADLQAQPGGDGDGDDGGHDPVADALGAAGSGITPVT